MTSYITLSGSFTSPVVAEVSKRLEKFALNVGMQDYEVMETESKLCDAFDSICKEELRNSPEIIKNVLKKIERLSDIRSYHHAPYEVLIDLFTSEPDSFINTILNENLSNNQIFDELGIMRDPYTRRVYTDKDYTSD